MKFRGSLIFLLLFIFLLIFASKPVFATVETKPQLTWQRSTEASDKIVTEPSLGSKVNDALQLPLDPSQQVFDDGTFTPQQNKDATEAGVSWSSWKQYSSTSPTSCGPTLELRRIQAKFTLGATSQVTSIKLKSPYYQNDVIPINDNAYIHINGTLVKTIGTNYGATNHGFYGQAPFANETDGWVASGDLGASSAQFLLSGENTIDIVTGETCIWGGMGKLELVLESESPVPFLDLPWDYQAQGKSFENVALDPFSWFDHQYPLQNFCCDPPVMNYKGKTIDKFYRSHNGYDYGSKNGVILDTLVLAAASGWATYVSEANSGGAGNVIKIDHGNGYQTWYEHLQKEGLIVSEEGEAHKVFVNKGQEIGKTGMTGNATGPHIHFSVFKDTDNDESFDDEIPYGVTDPLGWDGEPNQDPWSEYKFEGNPDDETDDRTGTASFNLFIPREQPKIQNIPSSGGSISNNKITVDVPEGASSAQLNIKLTNGPFESISNFITSVLPSFFLDAFDNNNQPVTQFSEPINISYDYSNADLSNIDEDSLSLYAFNEQTSSWDPIPTILDKIDKIASGETLHFSQFALMGQVKDLLAPETEVAVFGEKGEDNWYRSDVTLELIGQDNVDGIGLQYTLYTLNGNDWQEYQEPLIFEQEGHYAITFQSFDKAENMEERDTLEFDVDKTPPEAKIQFNSSNNKTEITGASDGTEVDITTLNINPLIKKFILSDKAGNTLALMGNRAEIGKNTSIYIHSLSYNNGPPISFDFNNFYTHYYLDSFNTLGLLTQIWYDRNDSFTSITYKKDIDQSFVYTKKPGQELQKEIRDSLILLQLTTNKGNLEYSY